MVHPGVDVVGYEVTQSLVDDGQLNNVQSLNFNFSLTGPAVRTSTGALPASRLYRPTMVGNAACAQRAAHALHTPRTAKG